MTNDPAVSAITRLEQLAEKWRTTAQLYRDFHATLGTGWGVCADELEETVAALLSSDRAVQEPASYIEVRTTACRAGSDGDCSAADCPQTRDGEPSKSGRNCPLLAAEGLVASPASQKWGLNYSVNAIELVADLLVELKPEDLAARAAKMVATLRHAASRINAHRLAEVSSPASPVSGTAYLNVYIVRQKDPPRGDYSGLRGVHATQDLAEVEIASICQEHPDLQRRDFVVHVDRVRGIESSWAAQEQLMDRLENYYTFECPGGPLRNCVEWQRLKSMLVAEVSSPARPQLEDPDVQLLAWAVSNCHGNWRDNKPSPNPTAKRARTCSGGD